MNKIERIKQQNNIIYFAELRIAAVQHQYQACEEKRQHQKKLYKKYLRRLRRGLRLQHKKRLYHRRKFYPTLKVKKPHQKGLLLEFGFFANKKPQTPVEYQVKFRP
jgi:hypothetical protein